MVFVTCQKVIMLSDCDLRLAGYDFGGEVDEVVYA